MVNSQDRKNPLIRNGASQNERLLPGLKPGYVNVDEKNIADWIAFAKEYAFYISYFDLKGIKNGNWQTFFENDISAVLGSLAVQNVDLYKQQIKERFDVLRDESSKEKIENIKSALNELFHIIFNYCKALNRFQDLLPDDIQFKKIIQNTVKISLGPSLKPLIAYYIAAKELSLLAKGNYKNIKVIGNTVIEFQDISKEMDLNVNWRFDPGNTKSWSEYCNSIKKDTSIFESDVPDSGKGNWERKILNHAANHNLFSGIFDRFLTVFSALVKDAEKELIISLVKCSNHPAHYALFLSFLRLFRILQKELNGITQHHLDYYYKEFLKLKPKPSEPDSAHILIELAKFKDKYMLPANTLFKAGKDKSGTDVYYRLDSDTTFNKAKIKVLRSVYIGNAEDDYNLPGGIRLINNGRLFAAPMINSDDGNSAKLSSRNNEWHPFANRLFYEGKVIDVRMPLAEIGFAIASHYLFLQEGTRKVIVRLKTDNNKSLSGVRFKLHLTTAKEWFPVSANQDQVVTAVINESEYAVDLSFTLTPEDPPVTDYNPRIHGGYFTVGLPVLKVILHNSTEGSYDYDKLREVIIYSIEIIISTGSFAETNGTGLKQVNVITDSGPVDTSKPFMPFGSQPFKDAALILGSKETFTKKNAIINLDIEWANLIDNTDIYYNNTKYTKPNDNDNANSTTAKDPPLELPEVQPEVLIDGSWQLANNNMSPLGLQSIFNENKEKVKIFDSPFRLPDGTITRYSDTEYEFNAIAVNGFMRLVLDSDFGHKKYLNDLTTHLIEKNPWINPKTVPERPVEPYTPVIKSISLSYSATSDMLEISKGSLQKDKPANFFHIYPFGDVEPCADADVDRTNYLLPQFRHLPHEDSVVHRGEFYIGIEDLSPQQSVNILFQVLDGSADPKVEHHPDDIHWSYLGNNNWIDFENDKFNDRTGGLVRSGIISFSIPGDATIDNTILPAGLIWIKAAMVERPEGVSKLISVDAQAASVTFSGSNLNSEYPTSVLPAGTISKLVEPRAEIKKITQPYNAFGGRPSEKHDAFYCRVSERLRHKARAVTIWDYEHLVLQEFPMLYRVKCLNHTKSDGLNYNELQPGHVTVITIPYLKDRNDSDLLKPYTSQDVLDQIKKFLSNKISCQVQLHVVNPVFEEIRLEFRQKLAKGYDDFKFYKAKLQEEITRFLSPWAFDNDSEISFGGTVYKSVLINFIEEQSYVDFITDVKMIHLMSGNPTQPEDTSEIKAKTAKSILVSVPASQHNIIEYAVE